MTSSLDTFNPRYLYPSIPSGRRLRRRPKGARAPLGFLFCISICFSLIFRDFGRAGFGARAWKQRPETFLKISKRFQAFLSRPLPISRYRDSPEKIDKKCKTLTGKFLQIHFLNRVWPVTTIIAELAIKNCIDSTSQVSITPRSVPNKPKA